MWPRDCSSAATLRASFVTYLVSHLMCATYGYNLDLLNPIVVGRPGEKGMFGFSVTFHATSKSARPVAIVGAPLGVQVNSEANGHKQTGALYQCSLRYGDTSCSQLEIDTAQNVVTTRVGATHTTDVSESKSFMRLGDTVLSAGPGEPLVACAPHYHDTFKLTASFANRVLSEMWDPVGRCYALPANLEQSQLPVDQSRIIQPCYSHIRIRPQSYKSYSEMYTCLAGTSIDMVKSSSGAFSTFLGGPGSRFAQGRVYLTGAGPESSRSFRASPLDTNLYTKAKDPLFSTGFAVSHGTYTAGRQDVAFSAPHFDRYNGAVFVSPLAGDASMLSDYDRNSARAWNDTIRNGTLAILYGEQLGEFFGYALSAVDVDADGVQELLVGAPIYADGLAEDTTTDVANGRVYIFGSSLDEALIAARPGDVPHKSRFGKQPVPRGIHADFILEGRPGSQFGRAISALGDLDQDGFADVAIGAPYEDLVGAVHIHYGSAMGLRPVSTQIITPSKLGLADLTSFGWTIGRGLDLDGNKYNDLIIGAPLSNRVVTLRSRPVVDVKVFFATDISGTEETADFVTDISNTDCAATPSAGLTCFSVFICATNTSELPRGTPLEVAYDVVVDNNLLRHPDPSANLRPFSSTIENVDGPRCQSRTIYVRRDVKFPCRPATLKVAWKLSVQNSTQERLSPIARATNVANPVVSMVDMTGPCTTCRPDMSVLKPFFLTSENSKDTIVAGRTESAILDFPVINIGDLLACRADVTITLPTGMGFGGEQNNHSCELDLAHELPNTVRCMLPPALLPQEKIDFRLVLNVKQIAEVPREVKITVRVASNNTERPDALINNVYEVPVIVITKASLAVAALSRHPVVEVQSSAVSQPTSLDELGPEVSHLFQVLNNGPSSAPAGKMAISWPVRTSSRTDLLYLTKVESTERRVRCNYSSLLDPEQLRTEELINGSIYSVMPNVGSASSSDLCDDAVCMTTIICDIPSMALKASTGIAVTWRVKSKSILDAGLLPYNLSTSVSLLRFESREGFEWLNSDEDITAEAVTRLVGYVATKRSTLKLWHIIVPVVVGLLLILLLVLLLWKCGFFKRKNKRDFERIPNSGSATTRPTSEV